MCASPFVLVALALFACSGKGGHETGVEDTGSSALHYDDADGDTIIDGEEGAEDADGDGVPNYMDSDSDGDGIPDAREAGDDDPMTLPIDADNDGVPDYLDLDSDNNCISDADEGDDDQDGDGLPDEMDDDQDGDDISDTVEIGDGCDPPDSDGDGVPDYEDLDSDGDGIGDGYERGESEHDPEPQDSDGDGTPDYLDADSDGDGIADSEEGGTTTPTDEPRDTDGDGWYDFEDTDSDNDGLPDADEASHGTDPFDADSDGDGFSDGGEVAAGTDPTDPDSVIDGLYVEVPERTETEEIFEFELGIQMGDVGFVLDTTGSMSETASALAGEFSGIVAELAATLPDAHYGYGSFNDYAYSPYGVEGSDRTFWLRQQLTDDLAAVQSTLSSVTTIHTGADDPAAGMEALYQAASGAGYDLDCDGVYDENTDILPFRSAPGDPFGGASEQFYDPSDPSTGTLGGMGFRDYALPILVYATDNNLRDPDSADSVYNAGPGGCPQDAGLSDVIPAVDSLGAYLIAVSANSTIGVSQMQELARETDSYADTDGDGFADNELVFLWYGTDADFRDTVTQAIEDLVSAIRFSRVSLQIEGDEWGFVTDISPDSYDVSGDVSGDVVDFTLTFRGVVAATTTDQLFALTLDVLGDESILLDSLDIIVVVPGSTYLPD